MKGFKKIHLYLKSLLERNDKIYILGEALDMRPDTKGLSKSHPHQTLLLPAADESLIGIATGLAIDNNKAIVHIASCSSLAAVLTKIPNFKGEIPANIIVRVPLAPNDTLPLECLQSYPHITVLAPYDGATALKCLKNALSINTPVVILERMDLMGQSVEAPTPNSNPHVDVLAWGQGVQAAIQASHTLEENGIVCRVHAITQIHPLSEKDWFPIGESGRVILADLPSSFLYSVQEAIFWQLEHQPLFCNPSPEAIVASVADVLKP